MSGKEQSTVNASAWKNLPVDVRRELATSLLNRLNRGMPMEQAIREAAAARKIDKQVVNNFAKNSPMMKKSSAFNKKFEEQRVETIIERGNSNASINIIATVFIGGMFILIAWLVISSNSSGSNSNDLRGPPSGMTAEQAERYDNMSPEGQRYVDDQMKKYDRYCSNGNDC